MVDHANTVYYFFSTSAQCFAAITAVVGTLSVFKYQSLMNAIAAESERLHATFSMPGSSSWASPKEMSQYKKQPTTTQKMAFAKQLFEAAAASREEAVKVAESHFTQRNPHSSALAQAVAVVDTRIAFLGRNSEFWTDWDNLVEEAKRLRAAVYELTRKGLVLLVVAITGTLTPSILPCWLQGVAIAGLLVPTALFALDSIRVVSTCFEEPWKTKNFK